MDFNADTVVAYLESNYKLKFKKEKESKEPNVFGIFYSYTALYDGQLEITIDDGQFISGERYVAINVWDKKNLEGVGIPCRDMELIINQIEKYEIEKKTGYEEIKLF